MANLDLNVGTFLEKVHEEAERSLYGRLASIEKEESSELGMYVTMNDFEKIKLKKLEKDGVVSITSNVPKNLPSYFDYIGASLTVFGKAVCSVLAVKYSKKDNQSKRV